VVSVGGLTESLVKASSVCLLEHLSVYSEADLHVFFSTILAVFRLHTTDDRVTVPVLNTIDLLFCNGVLDPLMKSVELTTELLALTRVELKTTNVKKIRAAIDVVCGLIVAPSEVRRKALSSLMLSLCHK
jgi:hypothetical protein